MADELAVIGDELAVIEGAFKRARRKALRGLALSAAVAVMLVAFAGTVTTFTWVLVGLNAVGALAMARRALRLWPSSPVLKALRDSPKDITSVSQWPLKLPAKMQPAALEIRTHSGALASVMLDPKQPGESAALVAALRVRAPDAVVTYPSVNLA